MIYYISNELSHHGVKGMRWGVRKQRFSSGIGRRGKSVSPNSSSGHKKMSTAKKVAIGAACVAAVAGVSYVALTKTQGGQLMTKLGSDYAKRLMYKTKSKNRLNRAHPGKDKANYMSKTMRGYERQSRKTADKFAKEAASDIYKYELDLARRRNHMYTNTGKPNFNKKTMAQLELSVRNQAKNHSDHEYIRTYGEELERARRKNYMYHK